MVIFKSAFPAMILAAGRGKRMRELTHERPKPLVEVNGRHLLDRVFDHLKAAGIDRVVVNACYCADQIEKAVAARSEFDRTLSREEMALETGGGVKKALPLLLEKGGQNGFFVINADPLWLDGAAPLLSEMEKAWNPAKMDVLLALVDKAHAFGDAKDGNYFIENGRPRRQRPGETNIPYFFTGIQLLHPRIFEGAPEGPFTLRDLYDRAERAGRLGFMRFSGHWFHVGTPEALAETQHILRQKDA